MFLIYSSLGVFYSVLDTFLASGFPSPFLFLFVRFADFGSYVLGGSFCRGYGRFDLWVSLAVGPSILIVWAWTCLVFWYIDPLPDIDRCHDVYSVKCNIVID